MCVECVGCVHVLCVELCHVCGCVCASCVGVNVHVCVSMCVCMQMCVC